MPMHVHAHVHEKERGESIARFTKTLEERRQTKASEYIQLITKFRKRYKKMSQLVEDWQSGDADELPEKVSTDLQGPSLSSSFIISLASRPPSRPFFNLLFNLLFNPGQSLSAPTFCSSGRDYDLEAMELSLSLIQRQIPRLRALKHKALFESMQNIRGLQRLL